MYDKVTFEEVTAQSDEQRLDNYLLKKLKGVPKSHIYRLIRSGQVRVNKKRAKPHTRLQLNDLVRIPPVVINETKKVEASDALIKALKAAVIYEDKRVLVINKPSGLAVHGGSGISLGLIEAVRQMVPDYQEVELVHRLDRETSGVVVIAKKRSFLRELHALLRDKKVEKCYRALLAGRWHGQAQRTIEAPLLKNNLSSGERMVIVDPEGKPSQTQFELMNNYDNCCLVEAKPLTGRTHQIRVHAQSMGQAIVGDEKYGKNEVNKAMRKAGVKRLFLHAFSMAFTLEDGKSYLFEAPLPENLEQALEKF